MTLVLATRNSHKAEEIQQILGPAFRILTLAEFPNMPKLIEDADTFGSNAERKACQLAQWLAGNSAARLPNDAWVIADDSGLEVDALNGAPGVHSARFAADDLTTGNAPDATNNAKLLRLLENVPLAKRTARFRCAIALVPVPSQHHSAASPVCYANETELAATIFEGVCEGRITLAPSGKRGFGYDPLFMPIGYTSSFAELGDETKNQISHRARALAKLREYLSRSQS